MLEADKKLLLVTQNKSEYAVLLGCVNSLGFSHVEVSLGKDPTSNARIVDVTGISSSVEFVKPVLSLLIASNTFDGTVDTIDIGVDPGECRTGIAIMWHGIIVYALTVNSFNEVQQLVLDFRRAFPSAAIRVKIGEYAVKLWGKRLNELVRIPSCKVFLVEEGKRPSEPVKNIRLVVPRARKMRDHELAAVRILLIRRARLIRP